MKNQKGREEEDAAASWFRPNSHLFRKLAKTERLEGAGHIGRIKISYFLVSIFTDFHEEEKKSYLCELCLILHPRIQLFFSPVQF